MLDTYIKELALHLSTNTYSVEYVEERLTNLASMAVLAHIAKRNPKFDAIGEAIIEPTDIDQVTDSQL